MARQLIRLDEIAEEMDLDVFAEAWAKATEAARVQSRKLVSAELRTSQDRGAEETNPGLRADPDRTQKRNPCPCHQFH